MERICVYPGSFDPITIGHMDVIERALAVFDRVIVAVGHNPAKKGCFSLEERMELIRQACAHLPGVTVDSYQGLLVDYLPRVGAKCVVRGLRSAADLDAEQTMAQLNAQLRPGTETLFLVTKPEHACISSSAVREIAHFGGDAGAYLPQGIAARVAAHFNQQEANNHGNA